MMSLANETAAPSETAETQFVTFRVGDVLMGIDIRQVEEISYANLWCCARDEYLVSYRFSIVECAAGTPNQTRILPETGTTRTRNPSCLVLLKGTTSDIRRQVSEDQHPNVQRPTSVW